ncbi:MAG TPA: Ig-like domain-containing protein, partial [Dehalococcoidia bacterium]|nr:Ig-like domain-containing protein [Dehalococcoidia bacterium]
ALYTGSSASTPFTIARRPTTITYNGATKANPNATVTVSATLVDDRGQAVAGKLVTFTLGSGASAQSVTATTDATGTATTTLKVGQHTGAVYPIAASFAGDTHYVGSSNTANFTVGNPH